MGHWLRHEKIMLDSDLAELYGVETGALNRAVKRNVDRFPADFMFQLTAEEMDALRCQIGILKNEMSSEKLSQSAPEVQPLRLQIVTLKQGQHRKYLPYAFTEQGVACFPACCGPSGPSR